MRVAIIGGGLVGSYIAWQLAQKKHKVVIFEQKTKTGKHACSGLISERIWNFIPPNKELVQNTINSTKMNIGNRKISINFKPKMLVMNRSALDRYILNLAFNAGAELIIEQLEYIPKGFDRIIGCDGALSITRKSLGLREPKFRTGILCKIEQSAKEDFVETWPIKGGFAWKIPRGNEIEYGVLAPLEKAKEEFLHFCINQNIKPTKQHAALVPQGLILSDNPKVALCGDAAGLTKPWSGGGVIWGLTAAQILLETFPDMVAYNRALKRFFRTKVTISKFATTFGNLTAKYLPNVLPSENVMDSDFFPF